MYRTGLEELVKLARAGAPATPAIAPRATGFDPHAALARIPSPSASMEAAARPQASWDQVNHGVAQQQAAAVNARPTQLPPARSIRDDLHGTSGAGGPGGLPPLPPARGGGGAGRAGGLLSKFRPGRTLGLMGLGAAGALAYGMHRSNANDRERHSLVYAPMQGSMMQ